MSLIRFTTPTFGTDFIDSFLDRQWKPIHSQSGTFPAVNVYEEEKTFIIALAAPGRTKKDFEIELEHDVLTLSSQVDSNNGEPTSSFKQKEFDYGAFKRQFTLPDSIEISKIKAQYKHGILRVELPKRKEALPQPTKRIAIE